MSKQLNINPEMDALARDNGLGHWSCVSPLDAGMWVRSDGCTYANDMFTDVTDDFIFHVETKYPFVALRLCDDHKPLGTDWQQPTEIHIDFFSLRDATLPRSDVVDELMRLRDM